LRTRWLTRSERIVQAIGRQPKSALDGAPRRCITRPALADERVRLQAAGQVELKLKASLASDSIAALATRAGAPRHAAQPADVGEQGTHDSALAPTLRLRVGHGCPGAQRRLEFRMQPRPTASTQGRRTSCAGANRVDEPAAGRKP